MHKGGIMNPQAEVELEKRKRCPKCDEPGREEGVRLSGDFTKKVMTMICENQRCQWFQTGWVITLMLDGSLPPVDAPEVLRAKPRAFPAEPGVYGDQREAEARRIGEAIERQIRKS